MINMEILLRNSLMSSTRSWKLIKLFEMLSDFEREKWHEVIEYSSKFEMKLKGICWIVYFIWIWRSLEPQTRHNSTYSGKE